MLGSSPRVWGQVFVGCSLVGASGIIPTRMGTSCEEKNKYRLTWDHPHACGDKLISDLSEDGFSGSSPRVWGQVSILSSAISLRRIIPTRVGTRRFRRRMPRCSWDHPHACGDKAASYLQCPITIGSSPRVWGQVSSIATYNFEARIIPTRVGTRC